MDLIARKKHGNARLACHLMKRINIYVQFKGSFRLCHGLTNKNLRRRRTVFIWTDKTNFMAQSGFLSLQVLNCFFHQLFALIFLLRMSKNPYCVNRQRAKNTVLVNSHFTCRQKQTNIVHIVSIYYLLYSGFFLEVLIF